MTALRQLPTLNPGTSHAERLSGRMAYVMSPMVNRRGFLAWSAAAAVTATGAALAWAPDDWSAAAQSRTEVGRDRDRLLEWFRSLPDRAERKLVSGQHITADVDDAYDRYVERLARRTGEHVAMIGVDYSLVEIPDANRVLTEHWSAGGLVTVDLHPPNPWAEGRSDERHSRVPNEAGPKPDLRRLLRDAPRSSGRSRWHDELDRIAEGLAELRDRGVVVLFRPLHEANGTWFWWGHNAAGGNGAAAELYRDLHDDFTRSRGLDNLLWVYSPAPSFDAPAMRYYPGDDEIDLIGPTRYDDSLRFYGDKPGERGHHDRRALSEPGKPLGWGECGPDGVRDGSWDARTVVDTVRGDYPDMTFFQSWHSWEGNAVALVDSARAEDLMTDPWLITRARVDWRG